MAVKTYREMAKDQLGITEPEMVIPETAHAAFMKAGGYFGVKVVEIPCDHKTCKADIKLVKKAINKNTIMLVGSAVQFPHGIFDDIPALASLAKKHGVGMHVDCCLGSFIVPFLEKAGLPTEPFDFRVYGVTSISCDTHKYGFAPKGSSIVMYRSKEIRKYQYFVMVNWTGGIYASPAMAGSRPGALIAGCWAAMVKMGYEGYLESAKKIVGTRQKIQNSIDRIPNLFVYGDPKSSVIAFGACAPTNIYDICDRMTKLGWSLNALQNPPAIHIACTMLTINGADDFLRDLEEIARDLNEHPEKALGGTAKIYGSNTGASSLVIEEVASAYIDLLYKV
jgi:sphinganine-1-phosphate aldolase